MTDQEDDFALEKNVFDDKIGEKLSWTCLEQTCSRYFTVFLSNLL